MGMAFVDRKTGKEGSAKQGCTHLANAAANAFDGLIAQDDQRFGIAVIEADVTQCLSHRKGLAGRYQQSVETAGGSADVLDALLAGTIEICGGGLHQLTDAKLVTGHIVGNRRFVLFKNKGGWYARLLPDYH